MWTVLTFFCMLTAEALQCGQCSHLSVCLGILKWKVLTFICVLRRHNM